MAYNNHYNWVNLLFLLFSLIVALVFRYYTQKQIHLVEAIVSGFFFKSGFHILDLVCSVHNITITTGRSYSVLIFFLIYGPSISSKYINLLKSGTFSFRISCKSDFHISKPSMLSTFSNQNNWWKLLFLGFPLIVAIFLDLV